MTASLACSMSEAIAAGVCFARALVNEPDILFADEPTGSLDSVTAGAVLDVFEDLMKISWLSDFFGGPHFMSPKQIRFIDNWEVEHYRRKVAKGQ